MNAANADQRSDIYTLGATLYHLLTGTTPYIGTTPLQVMMQHVQEPLEHPLSRKTDAEPQLCSVICKMMEKRPEMRYQNCPELLEDLQIIKQGQGNLSSESPFDSLNGSISKTPRKTAPKSLMLIGALSLACICSLTLLLLNNNDLEANSETPPDELTTKTPPLTPSTDIARNRSQSKPKRTKTEALPTSKPLTHKLTQALTELQNQNTISAIGSDKYSISQGHISLDLSDNMGLKDVSALQGLPIENINLNGTSVTNLSMLKNCGIKKLRARNLDLDLRQLQGFNLTYLELGYIDDLSHLPKLPLKKLEMVHFSGASLDVLNHLNLDELIISSGTTHFLPKGPIYLKGLEIQQFISRNTPR